MHFDLRELLLLYDSAKETVIAKGYSEEIKWQKNRLCDDFNSQDLLRECAWVILCSGFNEKIIRQRFSYISLCFFDWNSVEEIINNKNLCIRTAKQSFSNVRKLDAIATVAEKLNEIGIDTIKSDMNKDPFKTLQIFPYIGPVTSIHLAKNLGIDCVKPDLHMMRLAKLYKFSSPLQLCQKIAEQTGEALSVIDIILWRYCTLTKNNQRAL